MFSTRKNKRRRGAVIVLVVVMLIALFGVASLSVDVGLMYQARTDLQTAADAAAMAGAWDLLDSLAEGKTLTDYEVTLAKSDAIAYAEMHYILGSSIDVNSNDITVGYLSDLTSSSAAMSLADPATFNAVHVIARRDAERNGPIGLQFANIFGHSSKDVTASAMAAFQTDIGGFKAPPGGTVGLAPFSLHVNAWNGMLDGSMSTGDDWDYDSAADSVLSGGDGILEINMYPGSGGAQLPPGNYGTVDIGPPGNSTADLARQIVEGVNEDDLSYFGGTFELGEDGYITLNGDTGISAGIKDELASIIGDTRIIPLFDQVSGNGNTSTFRVVGFGGVRIMDVKLTGAASQKRVVVQPAAVVETGAISGGGAGAGDYVFGSIVLVR